MNDLFMKSEATFSECRTYRYLLQRTWDASRKPLVMVMLNPSIADVEQNDPTVERCQRRAMAMGFGGLVVTNIFALVSTDPGRLYDTADPVGKDNDGYILNAATEAGMTLCAWGIHGEHLGRGKVVLHLLEQHGVTPYCLGQNSDGSPKHPLYVSYDVKPRPLNVDC